MTMLLFLLLPLLLPSAYTLAEGNPCKQVTSGDCQPATNKGRLNSELDGSTVTGLMVVGRDYGLDPTSSEILVELWTPETSCTLPSIPVDPEHFRTPTLNLLNGLPVACGSTSCYVLTGLGWLHYHDTLVARSHHTSLDLEEGLTLVGGGYSDGPETEVLPVDGGEAREGFSFNHPTAGDACSVQFPTYLYGANEIPPTFILTGGGGGSKRVFESQIISGEATIRQFPNLIEGRDDHACSWFDPRYQSRKYVIVTGGRGIGNYFLDSTEYMDYTSPFDGWRKTGNLPSSREKLRAAKLGDQIFMTGGFSLGHPATYANVTSFNPATMTWESARNMNVARYDHGVAEVSLAAFEGYCLDK